MQIRKSIILLLALIWASPQLTNAQTSTPSLIWKQVTSHAACSPISQQTSVVFNNKMWVIGNGTDSVGGISNDVWWSSDGTTWHQATAQAAFPKRAYHTSVVFDGKMWVIGGSTGKTALNDVWWSSDGVTWTKATAGAAFPARWQHSSVVFNDKMWVIGGFCPSMSNDLNDVWWSTDGTTWYEATNHAAFPVRNTHASVVFDNKMWVIAGACGRCFNDVWWSSDGATWNQATSQAAFPVRENPATVVYDNKMWVIGGGTPDMAVKDYYNDVWSSSDGVDWQQVPSQNPFPTRVGHTSHFFNNAIWVIAGSDNKGGRNDVWNAELFHTPSITPTPTSLADTNFSPFNWHLRSPSRNEKTTLTELAKNSPKPLIGYVFSADTPKADETLAGLKAISDKYNITLILVDESSTSIPQSLQTNMGDLSNHLYRIDGSFDGTPILPLIFALDSTGTVIKSQCGVGQGIHQFLEKFHCIDMSTLANTTWENVGFLGKPPTNPMTFRGVPNQFSDKYILHMPVDSPWKVVLSCKHMKIHRISCVSAKHNAYGYYFIPFPVRFIYEDGTVAWKPAFGNQWDQPQAYQDDVTNHNIFCSWNVDHRIGMVSYDCIDNPYPDKMLHRIEIYNTPSSATTLFSVTLVPEFTSQKMQVSPQYEQMLTPWFPIFATGSEFCSYSGYGWYYRRIAIPNRLRGNACRLNLGYIDEECSVYVNKQPLGTCGNSKPASFIIPANLMQGNVADIFIRVKGSQGRGGIVNYSSKEPDSRKTGFTGIVLDDGTGYKFDNFWYFAYGEICPDIQSIKQSYGQ